MSEQTNLARRRSPPELFTFYSGDVRIDVLVASPDVTVEPRYTRQPFERVRPPRRLDEEHLVMRYPFRVRFSWASNPEVVLEMRRGTQLFEDFAVPSGVPRDLVYDIAQHAIDEWVQRDQRDRMRLVDYDRLSQGAIISWEQPAPQHMLAGARHRLPGQAVAPAVLLRIKLLLDQASRSAGFEAESAIDRARQLAASYGVSIAEANAKQRDPAVRRRRRRQR